MRDKARHDEAQALHHARLVAEAKGRAEGMAEGEMAKALAIAQNMLNRNRPIGDIMEDTGLTRAEIDRLRGMN